MSGNSDQERRTRADIQWFRGLGAYPAVALGVEVSTAVGLFALLGPLIGLAGASTPNVFLLTALALSPTVLAYAELSARTPGPGGSYRLVAPTLPGLGALLAGWSSLLGQASVGAILALASATHLVAALEAIFPAFTFPPRLMTVPIVLLITVVNFRGVRLSRRMQSYLVTGVVALLLMLTAISGVQKLPDLEVVSPVQTADNWLVGVGVLLACLWSVEAIAGIREEIRQPHFNAPRALLLATVIAGLLGAVASLSASQWVRTADLLAATAAIPEWAGAVGGPWAWWVTTVVGVLFSGIALNRVAVTVVRQVHAQGQEGYLPPWLTRIPARQQTPVIAVSLLGAGMLGLALWGDAVALARLSGLCLLMTGSVVNLAAILGRHATHKPGPFALPLHPFIPVSGIVTNLVLLFALSPPSLIRGGSWMLTGVGFYALYVRRLRIAVQEGSSF